MSLEDPPPTPDDDRLAEEDRQEAPPDHLSRPLEADEADVLEQTLEVPPTEVDEP
jgi:hypothetical protein